MANTQHDRGRPKEAQGHAASRRAATTEAGTGRGRSASAVGGRLTQQYQQAARDLLSDCDRSARYHTARRAFFDGLHRWMMVGVIIAGSATAASLNLALGVSDELKAILALVPALIGAISIVWGLAERAREHELMARRFYDIAGRIRGDETDAATVEGWRKDVLAVYGNEPAVYHALNAECHNAVAQAIGAGNGEFQRVRWWQHLLRHWLRFSPGDFPKRRREIND